MDGLLHIYKFIVLYFWPVLTETQVVSTNERFGHMRNLFFAAFAAIATCGTSAQADETRRGIVIDVTTVKMVSDGIRIGYPLTLKAGEGCTLRPGEGVVLTKALQEDPASVVVEKFPLPHLPETAKLKGSSWWQKAQEYLTEVADRCEYGARLLMSSHDFAAAEVAFKAAVKK